MKMLGKKAVLRFSPSEIEYQRKFGIMPDYHYLRLREEYGGDKAGEIVNKNMYGIWIDACIRHAIQERDKTTSFFETTHDNPFEQEREVRHDQGRV